MGRFLIFVGTVLLLSVIGLALWWIWNRININIRRRNSVFEIEKETHEKIKRKIKEEDEE